MGGGGEEHLSRISVDFGETSHQKKHETNVEVGVCLGVGGGGVKIEKFLTP